MPSLPLALRRKAIGMRGLPVAFFPLLPPRSHSEPYRKPVGLHCWRYLFGVCMTAESSLEARVPLLERDGVPAEVAVLYDKLYADRGVVPNMFKALANAPELVLGIAALLKTLMAEGALKGWYKELIATRVALLNQCGYCVSAHRFLAVKRGATPEQVDRKRVV